MLAVVREEEETVEDDKEKQSRERRCHHAGAPADRQFTLFCLVHAKSTWACLVGGEEAFDKALA